MDTGPPLAFTLPWEDAQEDMASRASDLGPQRHQNQGVRVGAGKTCPLAHSFGVGLGLSSQDWTLPDRTGENMSGVLAGTTVSQR